ncbi:protein rolling stone isoform X1 [Nasonia vitripennis]|uniref:Protein rolling stone n=2 Tax=Nasonia vitripennis TaxID=7425 RepID=A0A7M7GE29_NASVI|nr:protein rolling stone isoform X1 [Nasonia vitripennis]
MTPEHHHHESSSTSDLSCCLDACRTKEHIRIAASSFCGRRAMVKKLWCRELARKWFQAKFEPPHGRCFSEPKCQDQLKLWYLIYRWLIFSCWLLVVLFSFFEVGSAQPLGIWEKWPIYLTNWDLALGLSQSLLGVCLVTRRWRQQRRCVDFDPSTLEYGKLEKIYWFLYIVTSSLALGVTVTYWGLVHDPKIHHVDPLNILIHVSNSLLMLLDLCVTGVPFELRCFWWCPLMVSLYVLFSLVYYAAGGLDKRGQHKIYNILDWEKPERTILVCAGGLVFLAITHCLLYFIARFRDRAYERRRRLIVSATQNGCKEEAERRKNESSYV